MIRFYKNGTDGMQDGEEISNGDLSNPAIFDDLYPAVGGDITIIRDIHIRADAGETYRCVFVGIATNNEKVYMKINSMADQSSLYYTYASNGDSVYICFIPVVGDINLKITLQIMALGGENNTPDTSAKIVARALLEV